MSDSLDSMPTGSLDDSAEGHPLIPDSGAVMYALQTHSVDEPEEPSNFWNKLPFLKNRKKKK